MDTGTHIQVGRVMLPNFTSLGGGGSLSQPNKNQIPVENFGENVAPSFPSRVLVGGGGAARILQLGGSVCKIFTLNFQVELFPPTRNIAGKTWGNIFQPGSQIFVELGARTPKVQSEEPQVGEIGWHHPTNLNEDRCPWAADQPLNVVEIRHEHPSWRLRPTLDFPTNRKLGATWSQLFNWHLIGGSSSQPKLVNLGAASPT